jgi:hypothetical protein
MNREEVVAKARDLIVPILEIIASYDRSFSGHKQVLERSIACARFLP